MNVLHIAGRELRATFNSTIGWLVLAGWLFIAGFFWASMVTFYVSQSVDMIANPYAAANMSLTDHLLSPYFGNICVILVMMSPALSMRLFAEEWRQRTIELLFTSPVSTLEIVLGKFLGVLGFVGVLLLGTAYIPLSLWYWGNPDFGALAGGYASLFLVSASVLSMGMLFSATTTNQIVALVQTFAAALCIWVLPWVGGDPDSFFVQAALVTHIEDLAKGALRLSDVVYFASFIGFFLFATHQRVESHRWS